MGRISWFTIAIIIFVFVWCALFLSVFLPDSKSNVEDRRISISEEKLPLDIGTVLAPDSQESVEKREEVDTVLEPRRYHLEEQHYDPPPLSEIERNMTLYLHTLHARLGALAGPTANAEKVWEEYLDVTKSMPMAWDDQNKHRIPEPKLDGSIFVSLGTYRDPYCPMTLKSLYSQAKNPEKLFVGLLQQNCFLEKCRTGVLVGGKVEDMGPDVDCYKEFCKSPEGVRSGACNTGQVRLFNINESESLGPYMARYLGAKFYRGEEYYLQIDSHSEFVKGWDAKLINMVKVAPAMKPVISTYPPDSTHNWRDTIGFRMCDSEFAAAQIEWQIVRLGSSMTFDSVIAAEPHYAPFVAAGFFFVQGSFLREVPFDPFLPWIFMGEEISMSARLWTAGYDIFSPTTNVLNHYYVRRHYPKFWESVNRFFKKGIHNDLVELVLKRVKCMLGYPESRPEMINPNSVLYRSEDWSMGNKRSFSNYMQMVGLDTQTKVVTVNRW
eukprot:CAMPEP_0119042790 /NCGR_PEP_ID=MMETSP1177-20130426/16162_1 /TAXON_ID=2985 /ORGANISM="Ochromonas sp, Strain CCMP1899" /LENGTH=494 /DNA_ID=CAMNT_0007009807 /DNA_START=112 /DNA_END=1593 /DNA_ORIENTATION=+